MHSLLERTQFWPIRLSAQDKVYLLEHDNHTLSTENAKMSKKITKLEEYIQGQGLELPKLELKKGLHISR